jgi:uncharacterized protein
MKVAIIGGGVSGLCTAYGLQQKHEVTVFEAEERIGGHANTVEVETESGVLDVDTGFIVFNRRNYPLFSTLLDRLGVKVKASDMSFSVSMAESDFEFRGDGLGFWVQPSNLGDPRHMAMLVDVLRFNRLARAVVRQGKDVGTIAEFVARHRFGERLMSRFVVPLGSAIWSADPRVFSETPMLTFSRFMDNHGMLTINGRPQWLTVEGGSKRYVEALTSSFAGRIRRSTPVTKVLRGSQGVTLLTHDGPEDFDALVLAVHSSDALRLLADPSPQESQLLAAIRYQDSEVTLHSDFRMMPKRRRAWASWNSWVPGEHCGDPTLTYWMNRLQGLKSTKPIMVTLNRATDIDPDLVLGQWIYAHPIYDSSAVLAQSRLPEIQGRNRTWFCGAYFGYGFHEDGVRSAETVCRAFGSPW